MNGEPKVFLFLQGLPGPFFAALGRALRDAGHTVHRVNFNGGDRLAWPLPGAFDYRGRRTRWPAYLERLIGRCAVTDLVLFGDCRPLHRAACVVARHAGLAVHVFEEGYIRPDWVTLENDGVNGYSSLPRQADWYRRRAQQLPPPTAGEALPSSFRQRAAETVVYYAAALLLAGAFPFYRTHRRWHPLVEGAGWIRRLARRGAAQRRSAAALGTLETTPYFAFPLQLDSDYQLRVHSSFGNLEQALLQVLESFARHAPPEVRLLVKEHPLDNGLRDWRRVTLAHAGSLGIAARVVYLEAGDIGHVVRHARGVVTVNSTTGTLALAAGVPVMTLGEAVYDIDGLTFQGALDAFWAAPGAPDAALYDAFLRVLVERCLIRGGFYGEAARAMLVAAAVRRLAGPAGMAGVAPVPAPVSTSVPAPASTSGMSAGAVAQALAGDA